MFREAGLGPLIGKRSWGGVVGITNRGPLIDGGQVSVPEFGFANTKGEWIIEGYGVDPDIEVDNDPQSLIAGKDPQLERAISEVMARLKTAGETAAEACASGEDHHRSSHLQSNRAGPELTGPRGHSLILSFSCGSIAGAPLCCQQRVGPWTRREHGVPFLVRAPQV